LLKMSSKISSQCPYYRIMSLLNVGAIIVKCSRCLELIILYPTLRKNALAE
jgi:hypothetical protein